MNVYVDEHIAFEYPEDYLLNVSQSGQSYSFSRGHRHLLIILMDEDLWVHSKFTSRCGVDSIKPRKRRSARRPTHTAHVEDYNGYGFIGEVFWHKLTSPQDKLLIRGLDLFAKRHSHWLHISIDDKTDFPGDFMDSFLSTLFFPGEKGYIERSHRGSSAKKAASPYMVELPCFAEHSMERSTGASFNVEYAGTEIAEAQGRALQILVQNEKQVYERVVEGIFQYYSEQVLPILEESGLCTGECRDIFPSVSRPSEMVGYFGLGSLLIHEPRDDGVSPLGLRFDCSWDVEHGLGVRLNGSKVEAVGLDEIALFRDHFE